MKVYNKNVQILEDSLEKIDFILLESEMVYRIDLHLVTFEKSLFIGQYPSNDQVLLCKEYDDTKVIVYTCFGITPSVTYPWQVPLMIMNPV